MSVRAAAEIFSWHEFNRRHQELWLRLASAGIEPPGLRWQQFQEQLHEFVTSRSIAGLAALGRFYERCAAITPEDRDLHAYVQCDWRLCLDNFRVSRGSPPLGLELEPIIAMGGSDFAWKAVFAARWVQSGLPILRVASDEWSALVLSELDDERALVLPWNAFVILVQGRHRCRDDEYLNALELHQHADGCFQSATRTTRERYWSCGQTLTELVQADAVTCFGHAMRELRTKLLSHLPGVIENILLNDDEQRIHIIGRRVAAAVCHAIKSGNLVTKMRRTRRAIKGYSVTVPAGCSEYVFQKITRVDQTMRAAAAAMLAGGKAEA